jgi:hypothetical protein
MIFGSPDFDLLISTQESDSNHLIEWFKINKMQANPDKFQVLAVGKKTYGFASPTLGRHISTFRGYQILFSIRDPYINRFTDHFSIHS